ncbi:hypothetical protein O3P69_013138 [Scylla paramamosain]|uniref:Uncharacterized protein n=1 Tax=Scylla paramamosain TaxID=85552 RepID=A0AAW0TYS1_SCYPA
MPEQEEELEEKEEEDQIPLGMLLSGLIRVVPLAAYVHPYCLSLHGPLCLAAPCSASTLQAGQGVRPTGRAERPGTNATRHATPRYVKRSHAAPIHAACTRHQREV